MEVSAAAEFSTLAKKKTGASQKFKPTLCVKWHKLMHSSHLNLPDKIHPHSFYV